MFYTTKQKLLLSKDFLLPTASSDVQTVKLGVQTASARRIWWALAVNLERRTLHLQARTLCKSAEVSPPTFYARCGSCNQARRVYEEELRRDFSKLSVGAVGREAFWREFLRIIEQNRAYFGASLRQEDYWLLAQVFRQLQMLVGEKAQVIYLDAVCLLLQNWILRENCANPEGCLWQLLRIRKVSLGL